MPREHTSLFEADGKRDLTPYRHELLLRDPRGGRLHSRRRGCRNAMGKRVAALGASVLRSRIYRDRQVGDRQALILREGNQDYIRISRIEQGFVLDDYRGARLVRLLRQRVSPVGDDDLTTRKPGQ